MEVPRLRARSRFQYEMCIHDTALTLALDSGDFAAAINIIKNSSSDPGILNEGRNERFPLFIVLCGHDNLHKPMMRNLQVAQLLLEHGAQANRRGTVYHYMEAYRHSQSPMELLVNFFRDIQAQHRFQDPVCCLIGLDGMVKIHYEDIRNQLLQMMKIFISHGGRVSFTPGILGLTLIVDILWMYPDVQFLHCLYQAGVDINTVDVHGRTVLHILCQADYPPELHQLRLKAVAFLLKHTNVQASKLSCKQNSCVWHALKNGHFDILSLLLKSDFRLDQVPSVKVFITVDPESCEPEVLVAERLPPLLIPFVATRNMVLNGSHYLFPSALQQESKMLCSVAQLVDQGFFNDPKTEMGIIKFLNWHSKFQVHSKLLSNLCGRSQLVPFLLGRSSSKLKILCARKIFQSCLTSFESVFEFEEREQSSEEMEDSAEDSEEASYFLRYFLMHSWCHGKSSLGTQPASKPHSIRLSPKLTKSFFDVDSADLLVLLDNLNLPASFLQALEFELFRRKLLTTLAHSDSDRVNCSCLADRMSMEDMDTDDSSTSDESDINESEEEDEGSVQLVSVNVLR